MVESPPDYELQIDTETRIGVFRLYSLRIHAPSDAARRTNMGASTAPS